MGRKQRSSRSSTRSPRSRRMSWDGTTYGQAIYFAQESLCHTRVQTDPDLSKSLSTTPTKVHGRPPGLHKIGLESLSVHSSSFQSADSSCIDDYPKVDIDKDVAGVLGPFAVGSAPKQLSPELKEPLIAQLDYVLQAICRDHAKSVDMIMDAIRVSETRVCNRLKQLMDSSSDVCSMTPASISPRSVGPMADRGTGRSQTHSPESAEVVPGDADTANTSGSLPDLRRRPQALRAEKFIRSPLSSNDLDSAARRSKKKRARSCKMSPAKSPQNGCVLSGDCGSSSSALHVDGTIDDIQKYMMKERLRRQLSPKLDDDGQDSISYTSSPCCQSASGDDSDDPDPFTPKANGELAFSRRNTLRKSSTCSVSLESLRQQKDSLLILPEFSPTEVEPGSAVERKNSEASLSSNATMEEQWRNSQEGDRRLFLVPWIIFRVCGIIPWRQRSVCANVYSFFMLLLGMSATIYPVIQLANDKNVTVYMGTLPFTVSGLLGALSLRNGFTSHLFAQFPGPLELYAFKHGFASEFLHGSLRQLMMLAFLLICVLAAQGAGFFFPLDNVSWSVHSDPWTFLCFLVGSVLFIVLLYCQLHVICVLGMVVDHYCIELYPYPASCLSVLDWNLIQAMLRQIGGALDFCFMVSQTGACAALLLLATRILAVGHLDAADGVYISCLLPPVLLALGAFLVFYKAASVSEKCSRVAPLVNSMTFDDSDDAFDSKRMQIVNFISSSSAGFYIQEVKITASMAMKLLYVTALGASALVTKLATDNYRLSP